MKGIKFVIACFQPTVLLASLRVSFDCEMADDRQLEIGRNNLKIITGLSTDYIRNQVLPKLLRLTRIQISRGSKCALPAQIKPSMIHGHGLFATRDMQKGEVILIGMADLVPLASMNDAAMFQASTATNLTDMKEDYFLKMNEYREKGLEGNNARYHYDNYSGEDIASSLVVLKNIKRGDEIFRSYGIPAWIVTQKSRLNPGLSQVAYYQWLTEVFHVIFANEQPRIRDEALFIFAEHVLSKTETNNYMKSFL